MTIDVVTGISATDWVSVSLPHTTIGSFIIVDAGDGTVISAVGMLDGTLTIILLVVA